MPVVPSWGCANAMSAMREIAGFIECQVQYDNPSVDVFASLISAIRRLPDVCVPLIWVDDINEIMDEVGVVDLLQREVRRINESSEERTKTDIVSGEDVLIKEFVTKAIEIVYETARTAGEYSPN